MNIGNAAASIHEFKERIVSIAASQELYGHAI